MKKSNNNPFGGLPLPLVREVIEKSGRIAGDLYGPYGEIRNNRDKLREDLQGQDMIKSDAAFDGHVIPSSCCVDGCYSLDRFLASGLACSAAFAVEGLIPPSGRKHWDAPAYRTMFHAETEHAGTAALVKAVMMEMELELAAQAPHTVIFISESFMSLLSGLMENLRNAFELKDLLTSREYLNRLKTAVVSFQTICNSRDSEKIWAGIPRNVSKKELITRFQWPAQYDDTILFTVLLSPGEYTEPVQINQPELSRVAGIPIKDEKFASVRDSLVTALSGLHVFYYRPFEWTPALRFEISKSVAADEKELADIVSCVQYQCCSAGIQEPYPVYRAAGLVTSMENALPSLRSSVLSQMMGEHSKDLGELFSLLLDKKMFSGDHNG